jgi:phage terminase large subunit-like protein
MAGRQWGKTFCAMADSLLSCLSHPGFVYWFVGPTNSLSFSEFRRLAFDPGLRHLIRTVRQQPFLEIQFLNGSAIQYRSFDRPDNLRGLNANAVWVDEIQNIAEADFWPVVRPLISARNGKLTVSGQFRGENWYYRQLFQPGQIGPHKRPGYASWRFPASTGLMYQTAAGKADLADAQATLPRAVWEQEYECLPIANQAAVFKPADLKACTRGVSQPVPRPGQIYIAAMDLGRVSDPSAIVVVEVGTCTVVHAEKRPRGEAHALQAQRIASVVRKYGAQLVIDSTGGATGGNAQVDEHVKFYRQSVPNLREFFWTRSNKCRVVHNLALYVEQRRVSVPPEFDVLLHELAAYEYELRAGGYDFHAPKGEHDDYVSALAMAVAAIESRWYPQPGGLPLGAIR